MRITGFAAVLALSAFGVSGVSAQEAKQDFKLVNSTGYELKELYVSPGKASDWQDDVLGQATLADGEFANVHFHRSASACKWARKFSQPVALNDGRVIATMDDARVVMRSLSATSQSRDVWLYTGGLLLRRR